MLIHKKLTKYGYHAQVRYDTVSPTIYVVEKDMVLILEGESDIAVVAGEALAERIIENRPTKDKIVTGSTHHIPINDESKITAIEQTVLLVHRDELADKYITDFQCVEDEPSSDDLEYIEDDEDE